MNVQIGKCVKLHRKKKALTLSAVSAKTGLSVSYLSNLERGVANPSVQTLNNICQVLGITLSDLINKVSAPQPIVTKAGERRILLQEGGILYENATEGDFRMSSILMTVKDSGVHMAHHHIADEVGYIISGSMTMTINNVDYFLSAGDCIYIEANQEHSYVKTSEEDCVSFWTYAHSSQLLPYDETEDT